MVAVAPLKRVRFSRGARNLDNMPNVWRFDVGELRFWLHAEVGDLNDDGIAQFDEPVVLDLFPSFHTVPGDSST